MTKTRKKHKAKLWKKKKDTWNLYSTALGTVVFLMLSNSTSWEVHTDTKKGESRHPWLPLNSGKIGENMPLTFALDLDTIP